MLGSDCGPDPSVLWAVLSYYILVRLYCLMHSVVILVFKEAHLGGRYGPAQTVPKRAVWSGSVLLAFRPLSFGSMTTMKPPFYIVYIESLAFVLMYY